MHWIIKWVTTLASHWAFLAGLFILLLGVLNALWQSMMAYFLVLHPSSDESKRLSIATLLRMAAPLAGKAAIAVVFFAMGWLTHKSEQADHTNHMQNVDVIRKYDPHHYRILSEDVGQPYDIQLCPEEAPDWQEGMILADFVYEQTTTCQRLQWYRQSRDIRTGKLVNFKEEK